MDSRTRPASRGELSEVFRPQVLQVLLQLLRPHLCLTLFGAAGSSSRWKVGFRILRHAREQYITRQDRRAESQCNCNGVRWPRVDLHRLISALQVQLGKVGALYHSGYLNALQRCSHAHDEALAQIVSKRALPPNLIELQCNGLRLRLPDPDWQHAVSIPLLEDHYVTVRRAVQTEPGDRHLHHRGGLHRYRLASTPCGRPRKLSECLPEAQPRGRCAPTKSTRVRYRLYPRYAARDRSARRKRFPQKWAAAGSAT